MLEIVLIAVASMALVITATLLIKPTLLRAQISRRAAITLVGASLLTALAYGYFAVFPPRLVPIVPPDAGLTPGPGMFPEGAFPAGTLQIGAKAPPLLAQGWLNGTPPTPGAPEARLTLVDLWANW